VIDLASHRLKIALVHPQIAPNTGNIARLCVATGTELHLVRPLGFVLSDRELKRSAMDYWPRLKLTVHDDLDAFDRASADQPRWLFSTKGERSLWDADFRDGDWLIFGNETQGLPASLLQRDPSRVLRIPQAPGERCLNLSTAAGIGLYEAIRRTTSAGFRAGDRDGPS
jgi:tRNA (cytidine/uridine-2'-O-)-methyltransferase